MSDRIFTDDRVTAQFERACPFDPAIDATDGPPRLETYDAAGVVRAVNFATLMALVDFENGDKILMPFADLTKIGAET